MNKKTVLALAVGAAFAAPALAQNVQIYGRAYPAFHSFEASGATVGAVPSNLVTSTQPSLDQRFSINSYNTRLGFRGREMLGGGLNAIWQIEQRVQIDTGAGGFATRNSFLGLSGGFGTVKLGFFDTVYKNYGAVVSTFGISSGHFMSTSSVLSGIGLDGGDGNFPSTDPGNSGFHVRAPNSIQYETPEFGNIQAAIQFSPDEGKGNPGNASLNSNLLSVGVKYEAGPMYLSVQHERHNDWFDGSANSTAAVRNGGSHLGTSTGSSKDTAIRFSARYALSSMHRFMFDVSRLEWEESGQTAAGQFANYDKLTWDIGWEARWGGPWRSSLTYASADEGDCSLSGGVACSTAGLDATQINLTVAYNLSKRTFLYAAGARLDNGESARYDNWTNGTPPRGSNITQFALGVTHSF
jgi:predicted porin